MTVLWHLIMLYSHLLSQETYRLLEWLERTSMMTMITLICMMTLPNMYGTITTSPISVMIQKTLPLLTAWNTTEKL